MHFAPPRCGSHAGLSGICGSRCLKILQLATFSHLSSFKDFFYVCQFVHYSRKASSSRASGCQGTVFNGVFVLLALRARVSFPAQVCLCSRSSPWTLRWRPMQLQPLSGLRAAGPASRTRWRWAPGVPAREAGRCGLCVRWLPVWQGQERTVKAEPSCFG